MKKYSLSYTKHIQNVANNIKEFRKQKNYTQEDMIKFGFQTRHYRRLESGKQDITHYNLFKLAKAFNCEIADLLKTKI